jgi:endonuclease
VAAAPATLRTIHRPSLLIADVACPELSGRAGLECLLGRRAMSGSLGDCAQLSRDSITGSSSDRPGSLSGVRLVIARCQVDYTGRLTAHLPLATRLILIKSDGSVSIHADDRAYKPLNWISPPCSLVELAPPTLDRPSALSDEPLSALWEVRGRDGDTLQIWLAEVLHDSSHELGIDPGLQKDGVEAHLQALLAEHPEALAPGLSLVRREHPTPIGPVDLLCRDAAGAYVAVEIKRRGEIDGAKHHLANARHWAVEVKRVAGLDAVEQLTRYVDLLNRDPQLAPVGGILAAQTIKPQARTLANDRDLRCVVLDYDALRGLDPAHPRLF